MVVHNETSTGVTSRIPEIRKAIDGARHPALLLVDAVSSLGSLEYRHAEWGVDVTVTGSQKGLMLPPGLAFNAVSEKALAASKSNRMPRSYWDWDEMLKANDRFFFPYTPATNLLYGLREAIAMLLEEGLENVFARHRRFGDATRAAVRQWGLELLALDPREYSNSLTAVVMPKGHDADRFRAVALERLRHLARLGSREGQGNASSASATSATSTTSCWSARSAESRWDFVRPAFRIARAACRRRWTPWAAKRRSIRFPAEILSARGGEMSVESCPM